MRHGRTAGLPFAARLAACVLSLLLALAALALPAQAQPREVTIGAYVTSISGVNPGEGTFNVAFYVWFKDPEGRFDIGRDLYVIARSVKIGEVEAEPMPGGGAYTFARIEATVDHEFDFRSFPFDAQRLLIRMEAAESEDAFRFVPDRDDTGVSEYLRLVGWTIDGATLRTESHRYGSAFGYWSGAGEVYPQAILEIDITRVRSPVLIDDFLGFTFAFLLTGLTFVVSCTELGLRVGMTTGSLFAAVTNLVRLDDAVGFKPEFGMVDRIAFLIFGAIVLSLMISLTTNRMSKQGDTDEEKERAKARANRIDTTVGLLNLALFLGLIAWTVRSAMA